MMTTSSGQDSLPPVPQDGRAPLPLWVEAPLYIGALLLCFGVGGVCVPYNDDIFDSFYRPIRMVLMTGFFYGVPLVTVFSFLAFFSENRSAAFWKGMLVFLAGCYAMGWLLVLAHQLGWMPLSDAYLLILYLPPIHQFFMGILTIVAILILARYLPASWAPAARRFGRHALWATGILFLVCLAVSALLTWA